MTKLISALVKLLGYAICMVFFIPWLLIIRPVLRVFGWKSGTDGKQDESNDGQTDAKGGSREGSKKIFGIDLKTVVFMAKSGNANAQFLLGRSYDSGEGGMEKNPTLAREWLEKAAAQGHAKGLFALAGHLLRMKDYSEVERHLAKIRDLAAKCPDDKEISNSVVLLENAYGAMKELESSLVNLISETEKVVDSMAENDGDKCYQMYLALVNTLPEKLQGCEDRFKLEAMKWLKRGAEAGNAESQAILGDMFLLGNDVAKDPKAGVEWLKCAAEQGCAAAFGELGSVYRDGADGIEKNASLSVEYYRKGAEAGDVISQSELGIAYAHGSGVEQDMTQAMSWLGKAVAAGDAIAQYEMGAIGAAACSMDEAVRLWTAAAGQGHALAQKCLGDCYRTGQGVKADVKKAVEWFEKAANQGNLDAQFACGQIYFWGEGNVKRDVVVAEKWNRIAAEGGNAIAQYYLAYLYRDGEGVPKDLEKSFEWFKKAADQGDAEAQSKVALCYMQGIGVSKNCARALGWARKGAEQGYGACEYLMAALQLQTKADGVGCNLVEAEKWMKLSIEHGCAEAKDGMKELEKVLCALGDGWSENLEARAKAGDASALVAMGKRILTGEGCDKSEEGMKLIRHAAESKEAEALTFLAEVEMQESGGNCVNSIDGLICAMEQGYPQAVALVDKLIAEGNVLMAMKVLACHASAKDATATRAFFQQCRKLADRGGAMETIYCTILVSAITNGQIDRLNPDDERVLKHAAENGPAAFQLALGIYYGEVDSDHFDRAESIRWLDMVSDDSMLPLVMKQKFIIAVESYDLKDAEALLADMKRKLPAENETVKQWEDMLSLQRKCLEDADQLVSALTNCGSK